VIAFYNNIKREKLVKLEYALKTYLFAIGKNLAHKRLEKNKYQSYIDISGFEIRFEDEHFEKQQEKEIIGQMIQKLGDNCKNIIKLFYFQRYSLESIAMELQYKDKNVVKVTKNRCIKELKKLFDKNLITKG